MPTLPAIMAHKGFFTFLLCWVLLSLAVIGVLITIYIQTRGESHMRRFRDTFLSFFGAMGYVWLESIPTFVLLLGLLLGTIAVPITVLVMS